MIDKETLHVLQGESNATGGEKRTREMTRRYKFVVDGKSVRVCKKLFIATFGIGIKTVDYDLKRKQATDSPFKDKRGKGTYHNKTPEVDIERIHAHIDSFPAMESHYARKDSNRKFLNNSLNIRKMYDLYVKECQQKGPEHWNLKMKRIIRIIWSVNKEDVKRNRDKEDAQKYNHIHTATFDLEAVLPTPCSLVSQAYYKRKLSSYNFTVYSLSDGKGTLE